MCTRNPAARVAFNRYCTTPITKNKWKTLKKKVEYPKEGEIVRNM